MSEKPVFNGTWEVWNSLPWNIRQYYQAPPKPAPPAEQPPPAEPPNPQKILDTQLAKKGYGTISSVDGSILNIDNYWRKDGSDVEHEKNILFGDLDSGTFWQNGFKVHYEDYYQSQDRSPFSPLPSNLMTQEGAYVGLLLFWMAKNKPDMLKDLAKTYIGAWKELLKSVMDVGKTHPLTAIHSSTVFAALAHRAGLINDGGYLKIVDEARNVISVMQQQVTAGLALEGVQTFVEGAKTSVTPGKYGTATRRGGIAELANILAPKK